MSAFAHPQPWSRLRSARPASPQPAGLASSRSPCSPGPTRLPHSSAARTDGSAQTTILIIDPRATLRRRKPAKRTSQLVPRPRHTLISLAALTSPPQFLLLDTNIYINHAAGRLAPNVFNALDHALPFHCSVALAELACGIANANPSHPGWRAMQGHYAELFVSIPPSRLRAPDAQVWTDAGVIAGTLARAQGFPTAAKIGIPVLTANRGEFDLIRQLAPEGPVAALASALPRNRPPASSPTRFG